MASTVPYGGDKFLREFERAIKEDGLKGAWITSSLQGKYPDDDEAMPFFQLAQELDVPVVIHPPSVGFGEERMRDYRLASSIGRPMDGALAIARLIVRGVFEKFPKLKLVGTHLGGGICEMIGRMNYATAAGEAFFLAPTSDADQARAAARLKMMYLNRPATIRRARDAPSTRSGSIISSLGPTRRPCSCSSAKASISSTSSD
jgi:hypothetical protein